MMQPMDEPSVDVDDDPDADLGAGDVAVLSPLAGNVAAPGGKKLDLPVVQLDPVETSQDIGGAFDIGSSEEDMADLAGGRKDSQASASSDPRRNSSHSQNSASNQPSTHSSRRTSLENATIDKFLPSPKLSETHLASVRENIDDAEPSSALGSKHEEAETPLSASPESHAKGKANTPIWDDLDATFAQLLAMGFEPETCELAISESLANREIAGAASASLLDMAVAFIVARMGEGDSEAVRGVTFTPPSSRHPPLHPPRGILKPSHPPTAAPSIFSRFAKQMDTAADALSATIDKMKPILRNLSGIDLDGEDDKELWESSSTTTSARGDSAGLKSETTSGGPQFVAGASNDALARLGTSTSTHSLGSKTSRHSLVKSPSEKHVRFSFPDIHALDGPSSPAPTDESGNQSPAWDSWDSPLDQSPEPLPIQTDDVPAKTRVASPEALYNYYQTRCSLRNELMVDRIGEQIREAVVKGTDLMELDFQNVTINAKNVASISELLATSYPISIISFESTTLDDETLKPILSALLMNDKVVDLSLRTAKKLRGAGLKYLSVYVKKSRSLRSLDVSNIPFDHRGVSYLAHGLREGSQLETLRMDGCNMSAALLRVLGSGIVESNVTTLSLRLNKLAGDCGPAFTEILQGGTSVSSYVVRGLRVLDLSENNLGRGITAIASGLAKNKRLVELYLRDNRTLDARDLDALAEALKVNNTLELLDLSGTVLDGEKKVDAISALKDALTHNKVLQTLSLSRTHLTSEGAIALAESLPLTTTLRYLDLTQNPLDLAGTIAISVSMKMNHSVVSLDIAPLLKKGGRESEYDDNQDLAPFLNDISMYCQRNSEIRLASPESSTPAAMSGSSGIDTNRLLNDIQSATETAGVLEEMLKVGDSPRDVIQQLYDQTKSFQTTLQDLVSEMVGLDEELLVKILSANDVLISALDAWDKAKSQLRPASQSKTPSVAKLGLPHARTDSLNSLSEMDAMIGDEGGSSGPVRLNSELDDQMKEIDAFLDDEEN
ncbi:hypothetical protein DFJ77DRAFT_475137 [Powellomyces hirtus]|nr:hypothetical protein DFJ77DRAFT_475137 [Powellomyces hirtus]